MNLTDLLHQLNNNYLLALAVGTFLLIWAIKQTGFLPAELLPLASMVTGGLLGMFIGVIFQQPLFLTCYDGMIAGLVASGGHDLAKSLIQPKEESQ